MAAQRGRNGWYGTAAALALLLGSGVTYRVIAARLSSAHAMVTLPRGTLEALPLDIAAWSGEEIPLDESVIRSTDTDDHVSRMYRRDSGQGAVSLFVGYGVRLRDLMPHRPEVCYTGAGWTLEDARQVDLPLADGSVLPCGLQTFFRSGVRGGRVAVVNYYVIDGAYCADVSLLRSRAWRLDADVAYVAQVQIAGMMELPGPTGTEPVRHFAVSSAPVIRNLLASAVEQAVRDGAAQQPIGR
jgi:hypothetical protein